ncbi:MAG: spore germination protein [Alicyclobacillus sp.]|nr:spore germination protein [Alicyclobacillus sp.]
MVARRFQTVTVMEASAVLISTLIGVGVLALPRFAAEAGNTGGPLVTLLGLVIALVGLALVTMVGMRFPRESIVQYGERVIGRWPARVGTALLILYFAALTSLTAREFGMVVVTSVLERTPVAITTIVMLVMAAVSSRSNMSTFAYAHLFYLPFILIPGFGIVLLAMKNATWLNVQPWLGNNPHPMSMATGALTIAALCQGSFVMTFVVPAMREPRRALRSSVWAMVVASALYLLTVLTTIAVFGAEATKLLLWPTLELAKTTMLPGQVLERLDALFLIVWVTAVFTSLYSTYALTARALQELSGLRDHKLLCVFLLPYVFVIAMLPRDILQMYRAIEWLGRIGLVLTVGYPLLLLIVAVCRKQRGELDAEA